MLLSRCVRGHMNQKLCFTSTTRYNDSLWPRVGSKPFREMIGRDKIAYRSRFLRNRLEARSISTFPRKDLRENIYTIPNLLTLARMVATPGIGYLILHHQHVAAVSLLFVAGMTDVIDGYIARKYNMGSVVGTIIDPLADKFLMTTLVVTLSMAGQMPTWLAVIILGRDMGLGISALYWRWISLPEPKTFGRYWDFSLPSAEVHPTQISKINTGLQLALVGAYTIRPILDFSIDGLAGLDGFSYLVAGTTIYSGLSYIWDKNAVKIIKTNGSERKS